MIRFQLKPYTDGFQSERPSARRYPVEHRFQGNFIAYSDKASGCQVGNRTLIVFGNISRRSGAKTRLIMSENLAPIRGGGRAYEDDAELFCEIIKSFWGGYIAFLVSEDRISVLRDPSGAVPCFFTERLGRLQFFSDVEDLASQLSGKVSIDMAALAKRWAYPKVSLRPLPLTGIEEVLPGQMVSVQRSGTRQIKSVWLPEDFAKENITDLERARLMVLDSITEVREYVLEKYSSPIISIGGIDSSLIWGALEKNRAHALGLHLYSECQEGDERIYASRLPGCTGRCPAVVILPSW